MHHPTDRIAHTTAFGTPVVEHWLEREIAQWVHPMKDRSDDPSHHERTLLPRSYISLPKHGRKEIFYLMTHSRHDVRHMVKDHSDNKRTDALPRNYISLPLQNGGSHDLVEAISSILLSVDVSDYVIDIDLSVRFMDIKKSFFCTLFS